MASIAQCNKECCSQMNVGSISGMVNGVCMCDGPTCGKRVKVGKGEYYNTGGYLHGPTHEHGGIQANVNGTPIELEGGEYIINAQTVGAVGTEFLDELNSTQTEYWEGGFGQGVLPTPSMYQRGGRTKKRRTKKYGKRWCVKHRMPDGTIMSGPVHGPGQTCVEWSDSSTSFGGRLQAGGLSGREGPCTGADHDRGCRTRRKNNKDYCDCPADTRLQAGGLAGREGRCTGAENNRGCRTRRKNNKDYCECPADTRLQRGGRTRKKGKRKKYFKSKMQTGGTVMPITNGTTNGTTRPADIIESPSWKETHNNMIGLVAKLTKNANNKLGSISTPISHPTKGKKSKKRKRRG